MEASQVWVGCLAILLVAQLWTDMVQVSTAKEWSETTPSTDFGKGLEDYLEHCPEHALNLHAACELRAYNCQGRCGKENNYTESSEGSPNDVYCNCDMKCLAYGDCCVDFRYLEPNSSCGLAMPFEKHSPQTWCHANFALRETCPEVVSEFESAFSHLEGLEHTCSSKGSLAISSCSAHQDAGNYVGTVESDNSYYPNLYVTDRTTNITYNNYSIFKCNAGPKSKPVFWTRIVEQKDSVNGFTISLSDLTYAGADDPPEGIWPRMCAHETVIRCYDLGIQECDLKETKDASSFCIGINDFMKNGTKPAMVTSDHITTSDLSPVPLKCILQDIVDSRNRGTFSFSITVSLDPEDHSLVVSSGSDDDFPWEQMTCHLSDESAEPTCTEMKCRRSYFFTGDVCMKPNSLAITFMFRGISSDALSFLIKKFESAINSFGPALITKHEGGAVKKEEDLVYIDSYEIIDNTLLDENQQLPPSSALEQELVAMPKDMLEELPPRIRICFSFKVITYTFHSDSQLLEDRNEEVGLRCDVFDLTGESIHSVSHTAKLPSVFSNVSNTAPACGNGGNCTRAGRSFNGDDKDGYNNGYRDCSPNSLSYTGLTFIVLVWVLRGGYEYCS